MFKNYYLHDSDSPEAEIYANDYLPHFLDNHPDRTGLFRLLSDIDDLHLHHSIIPTQILTENNRKYLQLPLVMFNQDNFKYPTINIVNRLRKLAMGRFFNRPDLTKKYGRRLLTIHDIISNNNLGRQFGDTTFDTLRRHFDRMFSSDVDNRDAANHTNNASDAYRELGKHMDRFNKITYSPRRYNAYRSLYNAGTQFLKVLEKDPDLAPIKRMSNHHGLLARGWNLK
jgi:hypothetical protein